MHATLTTEQKRALADLGSEHAGAQDDFSTFCDHLLQLFEDIAGFENVAPDHALLCEIWEINRTRSAMRASVADDESR
jgi:hypothetical protein